MPVFLERKKLEGHFTDMFSKKVPGLVFQFEASTFGLVKLSVTAWFGIVVSHPKLNSS